jgi:hypothetical protein
LVLALTSKLKCEPHEQAELMRIILAGPDPEAGGISAFTREDLVRICEARFGKTFHPSSLGRLIRRLGFSRQKARSGIRGGKASILSMIIAGSEFCRFFSSQQQRNRRRWRWCNSLQFQDRLCMAQIFRGVRMVFVIRRNGRLTLQNGAHLPSPIGFDGVHIAPASNAKLIVRYIRIELQRRL